MSLSSPTLFVDQRCDWSGAWLWSTQSAPGAAPVQVDPTGMSAHLTIRVTPTTPDPPVLALTVGAGLTMGTVGGAYTVKAAITAAQSAALVAGTYWYELTITDTLGVITSFAKGQVIVSQGIV